MILSKKGILNEFFEEPLKVASADYTAHILYSYEILFFVLLCIFTKGKIKLTCDLSDQVSAPPFLRFIE